MQTNCLVRISLLPQEQIFNLTTMGIQSRMEFDHEWQKNWPHLERFARRLLKGWASYRPEDLLQDTYIAAEAGYQNCLNEVLPWLRGIMRNKVLMHIRKAETKRTRSRFDDQSDFDSISSYEQRLIETEELAEQHAVISKLPPDDQALYNLLRTGRSLKELALKMGISAEALSMRKKRLVERARAMLGDSE